MENKKLSRRAALSLAVLLLSGCAFLQPDGARSPAAGRSADVSVRIAPTKPVKAVRCLPEASKQTCVVLITPKEKCDSLDKTQIDPEDMHVRARKGTLANMRFEVNPASPWKFAGKGITFTGQHALTCAVVSDKVVECANKLDNSNYYQYQVNLQSGTAQCTIDPGIFNEPQP